MSADLFNELPFNLAGEKLDTGITPEGQARVRAQTEAEAQKAQSVFDLNEKILTGDWRIDGVDIPH